MHLEQQGHTMNRPAKILFIVLGIYVALVAAFETWLGYSQPRGEQNLVITLTEEDGSQTQRVLSLFESQDKLYLAANHWPRAWFSQVKENPNVHIEFGGERAAQSGDYTAMHVEGAEHDQVAEDTALPFVARLMMGFPPREFVRLEAR
tara:strand:- start:8563 stop:9006 length:444 start_codon:yes stop_codon:yes gene_type:complete